MYSTVSVQELLVRLGESFSPALQKIAQYVQENAQRVIYQTITEVADKAGSSEASVIRFCRSLGFSSFADFKMSLALEDKANFSENDETPQKERFSNHILEASAVLRQIIQETANNNIYEAIDPIVDLVDRADFIMLAGVGASGYLAKYGEYRLIRIGKNVRADQDSHVALMTVTSMVDQGLLICFSASGSSRDTVKMAQVARSRDIDVVAITNSSRSPLSKEANHMLVGSSPDASIFAANFHAHVSQLFLFEILFERLVSRFPKYKQRLSVAASIARDFLY